MVSFHLRYMLPLSNTVRWDTHCGDCFSRIYAFECPAPETWPVEGAETPIPVAHVAARAPGANEAPGATLASSRALQGSMLPFRQGWSLSGAIPAAGQATAGNLPHSIAQLQFLRRTSTVEMAQAVFRVLDRNGEAAPQMAHFRWPEYGTTARGDDWCIPAPPR